jgi:hypothetical protein
VSSCPACMSEHNGPRSYDAVARAIGTMLVLIAKMEDPQRRAGTLASALGLLQAEFDGYCQSCAFALLTENLPASVAREEFYAGMPPRLQLVRGGGAE